MISCLFLVSLNQSLNKLVICSVFNVNLFNVNLFQYILFLSTNEKNY